MSPLLDGTQEPVAVVEDGVVEIPVRSADRPGDGGELIDRLIGQADDGPDLRYFSIVSEGYIGKDPELRFEIGEQPPIDGRVDQIADECRVASQAVREGIVLQALFLEVEHEGADGEAGVEEAGN